MTDNEIIKALEYCRDYDCVNCTVEDCKDPLRFALSLINRQKAEIERSKTECGLAKFDKYKAEFEEFRAEIKAEAIKEFEDKIKDEFDKHGVDYTAYVIVDDVAREVAGDN